MRFPLYVSNQFAKEGVTLFIWLISHLGTSLSNYASALYLSDPSTHPCLKIPHADGSDGVYRSHRYCQTDSGER